MPAPRRSNLLRRRRRVDDDGEDEESVATEPLEDSQSEGSLRSDLDDDGDADDSDLSDVDGGRANGNVEKSTQKKDASPPQDNTSTQPRQSDFTTIADTDAMMNGLKISDTENTGESIDFDGPSEGTKAVDPDQSSTKLAERPLSLAERRRKEDEDYRRRKEADPAFIPNRGAFFMHDQRSSNASQSGFRQFGRGRGRGRPIVGGPYSPANLTSPSSDTPNGAWAHDLHESVLEPPSEFGQSATSLANVSGRTAAASDDKGQHYTSRNNTQPAKAPAVQSFSATRQTGEAHVRVLLPGMKAPKVLSKVPIRLYAKLPNHRPPLRRDKPVRIFLPHQTPRYIFPATERSFIFIPRALRPNQQGAARGRGRVTGPYAGYSSRRTSVYGGSAYTPSVTMSRRSSITREQGREGIVSPAGSIISRPAGGSMEIGKPVVRLPPGNQRHSASATPSQAFTSPNSKTPVVNLPPAPKGYPPPQVTAYRENQGASTNLPMHQPRPQKAVSVAGIESPASMTFQAPPQQEQQPFHQQVPAHINSGASSSDQPNFFPHSRQLSYHGQPSTGTPLQNIPERAIHAQPFQPFQQPAFAPHGFQPGFYYPAAATTAPSQYPGGMGPGAVPMFIQHPQQGAFIVPPVSSNIPASSAANGPATSGMVAHEQNGMVYYYDPNQVYSQPMEGFTPASYAVPGMGGMMTPSPDGYYYAQVPPAGTVFYQPQ